MNQDLAKSLVELIDETIAEIEELKKSDRFQASEISLKGPGAGIDGKDPQGKLGKEEDEKEEVEAEEGEEEDEEEKKKKAEMEKGVNEEKDVKKEEVEKKEPQPAEGYQIKKSEEEMNSLMKSMIDERVKPLESKIDSILGMIKEMADAPVAQKGVMFNNVAPLKKSDETEGLNKSMVLEKLIDLKKSGAKVDTMDITQAELGNTATLHKIVEKYNIK